MEEDQDNLNIQINAEGSSTEVNSSPQQKEPLKIEKSPNPEKEKNIDKNSGLDKKSHRGKGWLLFLTLVIILGIGFYFYTNKNNDGDFFSILPESFKSFFLTTTKTNNTLDTELEKTPLIPIQEVPKKIAGTSSASWSFRYSFDPSHPQYSGEKEAHLNKLSRETSSPDSDGNTVGNTS